MGTLGSAKLSIRGTDILIAGVVCLLLLFLLLIAMVLATYLRFDVASARVAPGMSRAQVRQVLGGFRESSTARAGQRLGSDTRCYYLPWDFSSDWELVVTYDSSWRVFSVRVDD